MATPPAVGVAAISFTVRRGTTEGHTGWEGKTRRKGRAKTWGSGTGERLQISPEGHYLDGVRAGGFFVSKAKNARLLAGETGKPGFPFVEWEYWEWVGASVV